MWPRRVGPECETESSGNGKGGCSKYRGVGQIKRDARPEPIMSDVSDQSKTATGQTSARFSINYGIRIHKAGPGGAR
jgi:hypothetical protein